MNKYKFSYGYHSTMTVTVKARFYDQAIDKACVELDRRYAKADREPPVGWTLELIKFEYKFKLRG